MREERHEVFRGHIEECVRHFARHIEARAPKGTQEAVKARQPIAEFCGVEVSSVTRWLNTPNKPPVGDILIKFLCYLDVLGYGIIELERMPPVQRNFAELIGFGVISSRQAADLIGYVNVSKIYQAIWGREGFSDEKRQKMFEAWKERKGELDYRKVFLKKELSSAQLTIPQETAVTPQGAVHVTAVETKMLKGILTLLDLAWKDIPDSDLALWKDSSVLVSSLSKRLRTFADRIAKASNQIGASRE